MIGPKKLSTIRQELQRALAATGEDPITWLEARMAALESHGNPPGENEVLHCLRRILEAPGRPRRQRKRSRRKK
jgi:hypothetical protein